MVYPNMGSMSQEMLFKQPTSSLLSRPDLPRIATPGRDDISTSSRHVEAEIVPTKCPPDRHQNIPKEANRNVGIWLSKCRPSSVAGLAHLYPSRIESKDRHWQQTL